MFAHMSICLWATARPVDRLGEASGARSSCLRSPGNQNTRVSFPASTQRKRTLPSSIVTIERARSLSSATQMGYCVAHRHRVRPTSRMKEMVSPEMVSSKVIRTDRGRDSCSPGQSGVYKFYYGRIGSRAASVALQAAIYELRLRRCHLNSRKRARSACCDKRVNACTPH